MDAARENLRGGGNMVGAAVGGAMGGGVNPFFATMTPAAKREMDALAQSNPQVRMEMVHEANLLMDRTESHQQEGSLDVNAMEAKGHGVHVGAGHGRDAGMTV